MTARTANHRDIAAYALGVLDRDDADLAESHLATCERCARDLAAYTEITMLLQTGTHFPRTAYLDGGAPVALQPRTLRRPGLERTARRRNPACH